jgi:glycine hydroxymethyltransferase
MASKKILQLIQVEEKRQEETIDLIASENYVSKAVREALGSVFVNKYAEGYPNARYYRGNQFADELENAVKKQALELFEAGPDWQVNVQAYSGTPANLAVYHALIPIGGTIMGMKLSMGGHLSHGHSVSVSGKLWEQVSYGVDKETQRLDYKKIHSLAESASPDIIVAGASAYSRQIDFSAFREIADKTSSLLLVDMSHIAGLVAAGLHPSPFPHADIIMTTTHKTLRGPRAALIFSRETFAKKIDKAVFPGLQGGPHLNQIAAVGQALEEAKQDDFTEYAEQVLKNADALASALAEDDWRIVSGGTDNHLLLVDTLSKNVSGKRAAQLLEKVGIVTNKNSLPYDKRPPTDPSGIRLGTPAVTTRGMKEAEMIETAEIITAVLGGSDTNAKEHVEKICEKFPVYN